MKGLSHGGGGGGGGGGDGGGGGGGGVESQWKFEKSSSLYCWVLNMTCAILHQTCVPPLTKYHF